MEKLVYEDEAGNKLFKRYMKDSKLWRFYAKNRSGKLISPKGFNILAKRAGLDIEKVTRTGIQRKKQYY